MHVHCRFKYCSATFWPRHGLDVEPMEIIKRPKSTITPAPDAATAPAAP